MPKEPCLDVTGPAMLALPQPTGSIALGTVLFEEVGETQVDGETHVDAGLDPAAQVFVDLLMRRRSGNARWRWTNRCRNWAGR